MIDTLNRFLIQNKSISIPGLGTIHADRIPARMDHGQQRLTAPAYLFRFDKYFDAPDKNFFTYLSIQQKVPDYEAIRLYNQFAQDFRSKIMLEEKLQWNDIGYFQKNSSGEVEFFQTGNGLDELLPIYMPVEAVTPVITLPSEITHEQEQATGEIIPGEIDGYANDIPETRSGKLDKILYIIALVLLATAIILLGIHFGQFGFNMKSISNQQGLASIESYSRLSQFNN